MLWFNLFLTFDVHMSVHRKFITKVQPTRCNVFSIYLFLYIALHVSGGSSAHHQEHKTVDTASGIVKPILLPAAIVHKMERAFHLIHDNSSIGLTIPDAVSTVYRPLPDNTRHSQQTNIHAPGGIRTHGGGLGNSTAVYIYIYIYIYTMSLNCNSVLYKIKLRNSASRWLLLYVRIYHDARSSKYQIPT